MRRQKLLGVALVWGLTCCFSGAAQEKGNWRAASSTAKSITGDVAFSDERLSINYSGFPMAQIRTLKPDEMSAAFDATNGAGGSGNLYRVSIPASRKFLHHNTLCGSEDTQWVVTSVSGHTLQLAFFSGPQMPVLTPEAIANSTDLCGTFSYAR